MMKSIIFAFVILNVLTSEQYFCLKYSAPRANATQLTSRILNETTNDEEETVPLFDRTIMENLTYTVHMNGSGVQFTKSSAKVDCFGLGETFAKALEWFFRSEPNGSRALDVRFFLSSSKQPNRVEVMLGEQFGLEWADFKIERRTVVIVHGFLSHANMDWVIDMEKALHKWNDVNVLVVDWSVGSNTWNYYKAAVNTRIVGYQISKLIEHLTNNTINDNKVDANDWGTLHLIGHSLGAHICGFTAKELKKVRNKWTVQRITGLDPAQPCFRQADPSLQLHKNDAPLVDVIHTNGRFLMDLGLGLPHPLGDLDFYPNGGRTQPGCIKNDLTYFQYLPISTRMIRQAICSHGRSYVYFTESLLYAVERNCNFWGHAWNMTYNHLMETIMESCNKYSCTEMGIRAENYDHRGTFFVATADKNPFCVNTTEILEEVKMQLIRDYSDIKSDINSNIEDLYEPSFLDR